MEEKTFLVVPTIRSLAFFKDWGNQFADCSLLIVEDHARKEIVPPTRGFRAVHHYSWEDIRKDFGENEWIFPRQNAGIRSYGFWKAYSLGADTIITLDDDCFPAEDDFVQKHLDNLRICAPERWFPTFPHPKYLYTRGFPYGVRNQKKVKVSHGLWSNKMDMDAKTQQSIGDVNVPAYAPIRQFVPFGMYFPMSSMNLAFSKEATPLMYFPLMGRDPEGKAWGYDRYDDIWAGIVAKKIMDHLGWAAVNGSPFVEHKKASSVKINLQKEKTGMLVNEHLWKAVDEVVLAQNTPQACYRELAEKVAFPKEAYFQKLRVAMEIWSALF
jgi:hypothetical protein